MRLERREHFVNRRNFMRKAGLAASGLALGRSAMAQNGGDTGGHAGKRPNIVFILADDMGYGDLGCLNPDSKIPTPNMDRLAGEGVRFTDAHSPSAVCTPTRYGILTGRYAWRTRLKSGVLWGWSPPLIDPDRMTVASMLKERGYRTACVGKWHLGLGWATTDGKAPGDAADEPGDNVDYSKPIQGGPNDLGFDYFFGIPASLDMVPYCYIENDKPVDPPTDGIESSGYPAFYRGGPASPGFEMHNVLPTLTDKAAGFIRNHAMKRFNVPFFLYFPLTAPHTPWVPNKEFEGKSRAGVYGDFVAEVDACVGRILDTLDEFNLSDNTLVILTSDNGSHEARIGDYNNGVSSGAPNWGHEANYVFRGQKADIWDGGHRVPFIARWPGIAESGTQCDELVCLTDFFATCADIAGQTLPDNAGEDSHSLLPLLEGRDLDGPPREAVVHHSLSGMFSVRQGHWKLVQGRGSGGFTPPRSLEPAPGEPEGQLYNLKEDIAEERNLWLERPDVVERLTALLERCKKRGRGRPMD